MITIKSKSEIEKMRAAGRVANLVQKEIEKHIKPGVSTLELDRIAEKTILENGGFPAEKGYPSGMRNVPDFPASICASINDLIIHGIPSDRDILREGDIISIDLVVCKNGYHGDCCRTYKVGKVSSKAERLIDVTKQAFFEGIKYAKKGNRLGDISFAIGEFVKKNGFSVIKEYEGHGIGTEMHEEPSIPNFGKAGKGPRLMPGMTLAIEPMVTAGSPEICQGDDGWSVWTVDGDLSAHYENTILITENEPEILTLL